MWDTQIEALADRYRVISYDVRGFGKSALPDGTPFRHHEDLRALLDYLDAPRAHVAGLSMGGRIALHHALLHPDATTSLVLVDSALDGFDWSDEWAASLEAIEEHARTAGPASANAMWLEHELFRNARANTASGGKLAEIVRDYSGWNWTNDSGVRGVRPPAGARLSEVRVPTLVIVGERDLPDFQRIADLLAAGIPNAGKAVIPNAGHMSNMENATAFNALLLEFLQAHNAMR